MKSLIYLLKSKNLLTPRLLVKIIMLSEKYAPPLPSEPSVIKIGETYQRCYHAPCLSIKEMIENGRSLTALVSCPPSSYQHNLGCLVSGQNVSAIFAHIKADTRLIAKQMLASLCHLGLSHLSVLQRTARLWAAGL